jgi:hypothetical protein
MDVIGFVCVSLDSSTVPIHYILGRRHACACLEAGFSSKNGDRAWGVYYRRAAFCCAKDVHKENFHVYDGKCLSRKAVHNWVANVTLMKRLKRRCRSRCDNSQKTSMLRVSGTSVSVLVEVMSRNKWFFFQVRMTCFMFYIHPWPINWLFVLPRLRNNHFLPNLFQFINYATIRHIVAGFLPRRFGFDVKS